jgi:type I restriction enzyme, S subunit
VSKVIEDAQTLKSNWTTTIGQICQEFDGDVQTGPFGSQLHASDYSNSGTPVVMPRDMINGQIVCNQIARVDLRHVQRLSRHILNVGDIVFSRRGDVTRFAVVTDNEAGWLCGTGCIRIRLNCPNISVGYVRRYLEQPSVGNWLLNQAKGITMPNLNTKIVSELPFVYPPLPEQKRIAEILDRAESLRRQRRAALALLDELTQSIFLDMFGDPVSNPKGWPVRVFDDVCDSRLGKMLDAKKQVGDNSRPYMRNINVQWGSLNLATVWEMDFNEKDREQFRLLPNDVLICEGGAGVAQTAIWRGDIAECYFQKSLHRVRPKPCSATSEYIAFLIRMLMRKGSELFRLVSSATIPHLTGVKLKSLNIPVPPVELQCRFGSAMELVSQQKARMQTQTDELDALFASLQHRAFRGEL